MDILDIKRRRLTLVGTISEDTLRTVLVAFDLLEHGSKSLPIHLIFSSSGGESYSSLGIYDRIKASPCYVTIECYGEIMSAGTVILQAGDRRLLRPNSRFLIHYGHTSIGDEVNTRDAQSQMNFEKSVDNYTMEDIYLERTGTRLKRPKLREYLSTDSYFTAARAVELGLADAVIEHKKKKGRRKK